MNRSGRNRKNQSIKPKRWLTNNVKKTIAQFIGSQPESLPPNWPRKSTSTPVSPGLGATCTESDGTDLNSIGSAVAPEPEISDDLNAVRVETSVSFVQSSPQETTKPTNELSRLQIVKIPSSKAFITPSGWYVKTVDYDDGSGCCVEVEAFNRTHQGEFIQVDTQHRGKHVTCAVGVPSPFGATCHIRVHIGSTKRSVWGAGIEGPEKCYSRQAIMNLIRRTPQPLSVEILRLENKLPANGGFGTSTVDQAVLLSAIDQAAGLGLGPEGILSYMVGANDSIAIAFGGSTPLFATEDTQLIRYTNCLPWVTVVPFYFDLDPINTDKLIGNRDSRQADVDRGRKQIERFERACERGDVDLLGEVSRESVQRHRWKFNDESIDELIKIADDHEVYIAHSASGRAAALFWMGGVRGRVARIEKLTRRLRDLGTIIMPSYEIVDGHVKLLP